MIRIRDITRRLFTPAPSGEERRLHHRAMQYWRKSLGDRDVMPLSEFDYIGLEDQASHGFLLDLTSLASPAIAYIGPVLRDEAGVGEERIALEAVPSTSLLARFAGHYPEVLKQKAPVTADYDFVTAAGYRVLCRGALLPLSSDGTNVDHVYGVVSWKSEKVR